MLNRAFSRRRATAIFALPLLAACGLRARASNPTDTDPDTPEPNVAAQPPASGAGATGVTSASSPPNEVAGARSAADTLVFRVEPGQSKAVFRVREQLARVNFPNDAVGTTSAVSGQLALRPDGSIVAEASKITVDLQQLATDSPQRDNFIKRNTLLTNQFPTAEFVPLRAEGLPTPLPPSGEHSFRLAGLMTIHGVQKEVTWDATATRNGNQLASTATTTVTFGDFGMEPPRAPVVLSVVDEIRLEMNLAMTLAA